jgi:hypothetical protein
LLCENALSAVLGFAAAGMDVMIGYTGIDGQCLRANTPTEFAAALAWPCCPVTPDGKQTELPRPPDDRAILIFALPRANAEPGALGRFANSQKNSEGRPVDIIFLYAANATVTTVVTASADADAALDEAAETCAAFYNRMPNVRARAVKVTP